MVVYIQFDWIDRTSNLTVEKFTDSNNEYENIWLNKGLGEILESTQFLYKSMTETYVIVNGYDSRERFKKHCERMHNRTDFNNKAISEPMKEVLAKYIKKQGIPGLKRFKVSDMDGYYSFRQNKYILEIKGRRVIINRDWYVVMAI